jgi:hypothetical protein
MMPKSKEKNAVTVKNAAITVLPSPKLNLHDLEAVRREMGRVYREMRAGAIDTQDGTRLVYVLGEMRKLFEIIELEQRIQALEGKR